jgi:hypothetical protein
MGSYVEKNWEKTSLSSFTFGRWRRDHREYRSPTPPPHYRKSRVVRWISLVFLTTFCRSCTGGMGSYVEESREKTSSSSLTFGR